MLCQLHSIPFQKFRLITIGGIQIIILSLQLDNIPGMSLITVLCITIHINTVNTQMIQKILGRSCISCTYCLLFPENSGNTLIILRFLVTGSIDQIRIGHLCLNIIICPLWDQCVQLLTGLAHCLKDLLGFSLCIAVAGGKHTIIPFSISSFYHLVPVMHPEKLRMIF